MAETCQQPCEASDCYDPCIADCCCGNTRLCYEVHEDDCGIIRIPLTFKNRVNMPTCLRLRAEAHGGLKQVEIALVPLGAGCADATPDVIITDLDDPRGYEGYTLTESDFGLDYEQCIVPDSPTPGVCITWRGEDDFPLLVCQLCPQACTSPDCSSSSSSGSDSSSSGSNDSSSSSGSDDSSSSSGSDDSSSSSGDDSSSSSGSDGSSSSSDGNPAP